MCVVGWFSFWRLGLTMQSWPRTHSVDQRSKWISVSGQPGSHGEIPTLKRRDFDSNLPPWYVVFITQFSCYHVSVTSMVSGTLRLSVLLLCITRLISTFLPMKAVLSYPNCYVVGWEGGELRPQWAFIHWQGRDGVDTTV